MASHGAAKNTVPKPAGGESEQRAGEFGVKFRAIHRKMAEHLAGVTHHLAGLHEAHAMLGEHLGLSVPGKSKTSTAAPTEADENQE